MTRGWLVPLVQTLRNRTAAGNCTLHRSKTLSPGTTSTFHKPKSAKTPRRLRPTVNFPSLAASQSLQTNIKYRITTNPDVEVIYSGIWIFVAELDDNDILGQAFIFIVAGFETSSSVISYALYELALQPDIQQQLRRELQDVLQKHNHEITYDAIADMPYLDMVVSETLRKYPTLPVLERVCLQDYKVPGTNITIEKDTKVMIPVRSIHYDPDFYSDPEKFDPERFNAENKRTRSNYVYLPFGEGPRICIGMRFGQVQVKTALVHILTSFQVSPCADTPTPPLLLKAGNLVNIPRQDIVLAFTKLH